ncbi:MAG TPA: hypothetical protein VIV11_27670 [Kofleriaceae bacterium]
MKRFITFVSLSTALAIGATSCAHHKLTKRNVAEGAATAAVIAGLVLLAANSNCGNCSVDVGEPSAAALPPR